VGASTSAAGKAWCGGGGGGRSRLVEEGVIVGSATRAAPGCQAGCMHSDPSLPLEPPCPPPHTYTQTRTRAPHLAVAAGRVVPSLEQPRDDGEAERGGLAGPRLRARHHVAPVEADRDGVLLHGRGLGELAAADVGHQRVAELELLKGVDVLGDVVAAGLDGDVLVGVKVDAGVLLAKDGVTLGLLGGVLLEGVALGAVGGWRGGTRGGWGDEIAKPRRRRGGTTRLVRMRMLHCCATPTNP